jgi:predicted ATPase
MTRYILTGAPGAGKTTILAELSALGYAVVREAATDVNIRVLAEGHERPPTRGWFVEEILAVQQRRQREPSTSDIQFFDRSPVCTLALAIHIGLPVPDPVVAEVERIVRERVYDRRVFFVRPLGFITATAVRRITFENSLAFEAIHERVYRQYGYELVDIPRDAVSRRTAMIYQYVRAWGESILDEEPPAIVEGQCDSRET